MEQKPKRKLVQVVDKLVDLGYTKVGIAERIGVDPFKFQNAYSGKSLSAEEFCLNKVLNVFHNDLNKSKTAPPTLEGQIEDLRKSMNAGFAQVQETVNKILELLENNIPLR